MKYFHCLLLFKITPTNAYAYNSWCWYWRWVCKHYGQQKPSAKLEQRYLEESGYTPMFLQLSDTCHTTVMFKRTWFGPLKIHTTTQQVSLSFGCMPMNAVPMMIYATPLRRCCSSSSRACPILERSHFHCPLPPFTILSPSPSWHQADVEWPQVLFNGTEPSSPRSTGRSFPIA